MKLDRKIKGNETCVAHKLGFYAQGQGHNQVTGQNCILTITQKLLKQIQRNLIERLNIMRMCVAHKRKVPRPKVNVTIMSEVKLYLKLCCS